MINELTERFADCDDFHQRNQRQNNKSAAQICAHFDK